MSPWKVNENSIHGELFSFAGFSQSSRIAIFAHLSVRVCPPLNTPESLQPAPTQDSPHPSSLDLVHKAEVTLHSVPQVSQVYGSQTSPVEPHRRSLLP